ncbi:ISAs1 family transposase, partial [Sansalvadorimonas sp. 2012CJ34-2]
PKQFEKCFSDWMKACHTATDGAVVVAIDGKTLRRSYDTAQSRDPIHMVSAFCTENSVVLGQVKTDEKSNEITAIPDLLGLLEIKGCLVTIDAMGCQRAIAEKIVDDEADYLLAVKGNQPKLHAAFEKHFPLHKILSGAFEETYETKDKGHGRSEHRIHVVSGTFDEFVNLSFDWKGLQKLGAVVAFRQVGDTPQNIENVSIRYYISSAELTAESLANSVRSHWAVENKLHYVLDVAMNEDQCRIRRDNGAETLARFRHVALNLLKNEKTAKGGIRRKMKRAAMSTEYMDLVLAGAPLVEHDA